MTWAIWLSSLGPGDFLPKGLSDASACISSNGCSNHRDDRLVHSAHAAPAPGQRVLGRSAHKLVGSFAHATARGTSVVADGPPMRPRSEERGSKPYCFSMTARVSIAVSDIPGVPR